MVKPLFPNYLFAKLDLDVNYTNAKWTRGVSRILGSREGPVPISERVVQVLQERVGKDELIELEEEIKTGDHVQITSGPLKDLIGVFKRRCQGKTGEDPPESNWCRCPGSNIKMANPQGRLTSGAPHPLLTLPSRRRG